MSTNWCQPKTEMGSNCLVCNNVVEVKSQPSFKNLDLDDDESDLSNTNRKKQVHQLKTYLGLFCKLIDLNVDDSFGYLFTSPVTSGNNSVPNDRSLLAPSCCSRCHALLNSIWDLQKMISRTQDLQQTDVNLLKQLLNQNPSKPYKIEDKRTKNLTQTQPFISSTKRCSVVLNRCDDIPYTSTKAPHSSPALGASPNSPILQAKLKAVESFKKLPASEYAEEIKTEQDTDFDPNEDYFDSQDLPSDNEKTENEDKINKNMLCSKSKVNRLFSHQETQLLLQLMKENHHILYGPQPTVADKRRKNVIFRKITDAINQVDRGGMTVQQIREKLKYIRKTSKTISADNEQVPSETEDKPAEDPALANTSVKAETPINDPQLKPSPISDAISSDPGLHPGRKNAARFSTAEVQLVTTLMHQNLDHLYGPYRDIQTKEIILKKITQAVNEVGGMHRTKEQILEKMKYIRKLETKIPGTTVKAKKKVYRRKMERKNAVPFSNEEVQLLSKLLNENATTLCGRTGSTVTRDKMLVKITHAVNQLGGNRSKEQVREKLKYIRRKLENKIPKKIKPDIATNESKTPEIDETETERSISENKSETENVSWKPDPPRARVMINDKLRYQCSKCEQHFHFFHRLKSHELTHLPKAVRPLFDCPKCDDKFLSKTAVAIHLIGVHKEAPPNRPRSKVKFHKCHICDKKFFWFQRNRFSCHVQSHAGDNRPRPHMCEICGQGFFLKDTLQRHANVHSTERRFQCEFCAENYKHRNNLRRHRKSCHKDLITDLVPKSKPSIPVEYTPDFIGPRIAYPCEFCEKAFPLRSRMTKHLEICKVRKGMQFK